jgi:hypothetical protein
MTVCFPELRCETPMHPFPTAERAPVPRGRARLECLLVGREWYAGWNRKKFTTVMKSLSENRKEIACLSSSIFSNPLPEYAERSL